MCRGQADSGLAEGSPRRWGGPDPSPVTGQACAVVCPKRGLLAPRRQGRPWDATRRTADGTALDLDLNPSVSPPLPHRVALSKWPGLSGPVSSAVKWG